MGTSNACQYGLSEKHIERLCIPASVTGTACGIFVTTTTEAVTPTNIDPENDRLKLAASSDVSTSVPGLTFEEVDIADEDMVAPLTR